MDTDIADYLKSRSLELLAPAFRSAVKPLAYIMTPSPISTINGNGSLRLTDFLKIAENRRRSSIGDETYNKAYARLRNDLNSLPDNYVSIGKSDYEEAINALANIALGSDYTGLDDSLVSNASTALYNYYNSYNPFSNKRDIFGTQGVFNTGDPVQDYRNYLIAMKYFITKELNPFGHDSDEAVFNSFQDLKNNQDLWQEALRLANGENSTAEDLRERNSKASENPTVNQGSNTDTLESTKEEDQAAFKRMFG